MADNSGNHNVSMSKLLPVGTLIDGRYEILSKLGAGGFATVYRAHHKILNRDIALKVMEPQTGIDDPTYVERFAREAQIAAKIQHPNVVTIYDFGKIPETDQPYIAMELLEGHDLEHEIYKISPLTPKRMFKLFRPVLEALGEGHKQGIVHKDLKPANLYVMNPGTDQEYLKVLDFGVARINDSDFSKLTAAGQLMGTPRYLAPEYIKKGIATPAVDVYQMALIMSEALCGRCCVDGIAYDVVMKHCNGEIQLTPFLTEGPVGEVIRGATCIDYTMRYADCNEFGEALDKVKSYFDAKDEIVVDLPAPVGGVQPQAPEVHKTMAISVNQDAQKPSGAIKYVFIGAIAVVAIAAILVGIFGYSKKQVEDEQEAEAAKLAEELQKAEDALQKAINNEQIYASEMNIPQDTPDPADIEELWKRARAGSDDSKEKLGLHYMKSEEPLSGSQKAKAYEALSSANQLNDPEAIYYLAQLEASRTAREGILLNKKRQNEILRLYKRSAEKHYEPALVEVQKSQFSPEASSWAYSILEEIYDKRAKEKDPEALYQMGALLESISDIPSLVRSYKNWQNPKPRTGETFLSYFKKASDAGSPKGQFHYAKTVLFYYNLKAGLELIKKAKDNGSSEAASFLFELYTEAACGTQINPHGIKQFDELYKAISSDYEAWESPFEELNILLSQAGPIDETILNTLTRCCADDNGNQAKCNLMFSAIQKHIELNKFSRSSCDKTAEMLLIMNGMYNEEATSFFTPEQLKRISNMYISNYRTALARGEMYSSSGMGKYSTAYILSSLYMGSPKWQIPTDLKQSIAATIYGAQANDGLCQYKVASYYTEGNEFIEKNETRACYWANRGFSSPMVAFCKSGDSADYTAICSEFDIKKDSFKDCKEKAEK